MKCTQARCYLSPYLDSELDGKTTFEISRHLEICPACARLFAQEGELDRAISDRIKLPEGDESAVLERVLGRTLSSRGFLRRRGFWAAAILLLLLLGTWAFWNRGGHPRAPALVAMVAGDHLRYLKGEAPFECTSEKAHEVEAFLMENLDVACALPAGEPWEVQGARICRFEGTRIGLVTLSYEGIAISVGDLPAGEHPLPDDALAAAETGDCFELPGGRGMVGRTACGLRVVFGDVEAVPLAEAIAAGRSTARPPEGDRR